MGYTKSVIYISCFIFNFKIIMGFNRPFFTLAFCLKGKAMVMAPPVFSQGHLSSERFGEIRQEQTFLQRSAAKVE